MSPSKPLGTLIVSPGMPGIEVAVFDGRLRRLAPDEGVDEFRWSVPRGIYAVRYQAGSIIDEHIVTVDRLDQPVHAPAARLEFTSSAPLSQTSSTHEYHTAPAVATSHKAPIVLGNGATLLAMVRSRDGVFRRQSPAEGLTLERNDQTVLDFTKLERDPGNTCAALHVALDPGAYTLAYQTPDCATRQTIYVTAGWQTQLFISEAASGSETGPVALDLAGLAVLMARPGEGFDPGGFGVHASELARKALRRGKSAISPRQIQLLLEDKFDNPMLGILGAHLMLLRSNTRNDVVASVLTHLDRLAPGHPDAACLRLALDPNAGVDVTSPPMLTRSWDLLVNASTLGALLTRSDALNEVAGSLWDTGGAWLTWGAMTGAEASGDSLRPQVLEIVRNFGNPYLVTRDRTQQNTARAILMLVSDEAATDKVDLLRARTRLLGLSQSLGSALAEEFNFSESEAAFINVATLAYAHGGRDGVQAPLLAPQVRMPVPFVRTTARRLADRLAPPRQEGSPSRPLQQEGGLAQGASS